MRRTVVPHSNVTRSTHGALSDAECEAPHRREKPATKATIRIGVTRRYGIA
jgi:hypothetical protein